MPECSLIEQSRKFVGFAHRFLERKRGPYGEGAEMALHAAQNFHLCGYRRVSRSNFSYALNTEGSNSLSNHPRKRKDRAQFINIDLVLPVAVARIKSKGFLKRHLVRRIPAFGYAHHDCDVPVG
jgi:hypothetical protein